MKVLCFNSSDGLEGWRGSWVWRRATGATRGLWGGEKLLRRKHLVAFLSLLENTDLIKGKRNCGETARSIRWPGCRVRRCPGGCSETLVFPGGLPRPCCLGEAWLPAPAVGPEPLLGADRKTNKRLIENKMNLAAWWAGISAWLRGAACLGWEEELARQ